ncbi:MAG: hypothetical protein GTO04_11690, partial [Planctomycetales bacterium]|nr:hypothetical protein [Planctomycetales bacterium]
PPRRHESSAGWRSRNWHTGAAWQGLDDVRSDPITELLGACSRLWSGWRRGGVFQCQRHSLRPRYRHRPRGRLTFHLSDWGNCDR